MFVGPFRDPIDESSGAASMFRHTRQPPLFSRNIDGRARRGRARKASLAVRDPDASVQFVSAS